MQKWILDGLTVGVVSLATGGVASLLNSSLLNSTDLKVPLLGSGVGSVVSSTVLAKRRNKELLDLEKQFQKLSSCTKKDQYQQLTSDGQEEAREKVDNNSSKPTQLYPSPERQKEEEKSEKATSGLIDVDLLDLNNNSPNNQDEIVEYLAEKEVSVEARRSTDHSVDQIFNKQAIYLGNNLKDEQNKPLLAPLLKQIKWSISKNGGVQYHLKNADQAQIQAATQFCHNLHKDSLLSSYFYARNQKIIHASVQDRGDVRSFFNGEWFERFICFKISEAFESQNLNYSYIMNPVIKFPNGDRFELDLLLLSNNQLMLFECKTGGNFNAHLRKFSDHRNRLNIEADRAFLVILDLEISQAERLSRFWKFKVTNQDNLVQMLQQSI